MEKTDIIQKEIEKRLREVMGHHTEQAIVCRMVYRELLDFIVSIKNEKPKCKLEEDLEKETERYMKLGGWGLTQEREDIAACARHFSRWQKEQMLKDSLDAKVLPCNYEETEFCLDDYDVDFVTDKVKSGEFKCGDTVKVIVVKED